MNANSLPSAPTLVDIGHARLAYRRVGTGPDVVFIHGWPLSSATFASLVGHLSAEFTCHLFDLPGAGASEWSDATPLDLISHVASLRAAVDAVGLTSFGVVAFDSGGLVARYLAAEDERVQSLVLSGTEIPGHHPTLVAMLQFGARLPGFVAELRWLLGQRWFVRSGLGFGGSYVDRSRIDDTFIDAFITPLRSDRRALDAAVTLLTTFTTEMTDGLAAVHPKLDLPVQLIWGEQDPFFPAGLAREMASQFPNAAFASLEGGSLLVHDECAAEYAALAAPVLRTSERRAAA